MLYCPQHHYRKRKQQKDIKNIEYTIKCYLVLKREGPASFSYLQIFTLYAIQILIYVSSSFFISVCNIFMGFEVSTPNYPVPS